MLAAAIKACCTATLLLNVAGFGDVCCWVWESACVCCCLDSSSCSSSSSSFCSDSSSSSASSSSCCSGLEGCDSGGVACVGEGVACDSAEEGLCRCVWPQSLWMRNFITSRCPLRAACTRAHWPCLSRWSSCGQTHVWISFWCKLCLNQSSNLINWLDANSVNQSGYKTLWS